MEQKLFWLFCSLCVVACLQLSFYIVKKAWLKRLNDERQDMSFREELDYQFCGSVLTIAVFFIVFCFVVLDLQEAFLLLVITALLLNLADIKKIKLNFRSCLKIFSLGCLVAFFLGASVWFALAGLFAVIILLCMFAWQFNKENGTSKTKKEVQLKNPKK